MCPYVLVHDAVKYGVGHTKFYHGLSVALLAMFVLQYATGAFVSSLFAYGLELSWSTLREFCTEYWYM